MRMLMPIQTLISITYIDQMKSYFEIIIANPSERSTKSEFGQFKIGLRTLLKIIQLARIGSHI